MRSAPSRAKMPGYQFNGYQNKCLHYAPDQASHQAGASGNLRNGPWPGQRLDSMKETRRPIKKIVSWETAWTACCLIFPTFLFLILFHDRFDFEGFWEFYPFRIFAHQTLSEGIFPTWMPSLHCGFPILAASESGIANPINLLVGGKTSYLLFPIATLLATGLFTYLYFRRLQISPISASIFIIPCIIGPVNLYWFSNVNNLFVVALFPLGLFLIEGIIEKRALSTSVWFGIATALMIVGGHPQLAYFNLILLGLYGTIRVALYQSAGNVKLRALGLLAFGFLLGAALSAYQIFPLLEMVPETLRAEYDPALRESGSLSFAMLSHLIFSRSFDFNLLGEVNTLPYIGILPLTFCLLSIRNKRTSWSNALWIMAALALLLSMGYNTPLYHLFSLLPGFSMLRKSYWFAGYASFFLCAFAGQGLDAFRLSSKAKENYFLTIALLVLLLICGFCTSFYDAIEIIRRWNTVPYAVVGLLVLLTWGAVRLLHKQPSKGIYFILALIIVLDLSLYGLWRETPRARSVFETGDVAPSPVVSYLSYNKLLGERLALLPSDMPLKGFVDADKKPSSEMDLAFGIRSFWGWDEPSLRLRRMEMALHRLLDKDVNLNYLSMAGVGLIQSGFPLNDSRLTLLDKQNDYYLYRNKNRMPRAYLAPGLLVVDGPERSLDAIADESFDPAKTTIVEGSPAARSQGKPLGMKVVMERAGRIEIHATAEKPSLLVLTENFYPGWKAKVNGGAAGMLVANHQFMAVDIPAGDSRVEFVYDSKTLKTGAALSLGAFLFCMAVLLLSVGRMVRSLSEKRL